MKKIVYSAALALALPMMTAAQTLSGGISNADSIVTFIKNLLNVILPLIIAAAVVYFVWGVFQLFLAKDEAEKREKAKHTIIYGIIAIFVMVSVWGLVNILSNTFRLQNAPQNANLNPLGNIPGAQ